MASLPLALIAFNRGIVSRLGLARQDVKRIAMSAAQMVNWLPRVLGSMSIRPGLGYLGSTRSNGAARYLEFIFSTSDKALLELTDLVLRVWVSDALITRGAVGSVVTNGDFAINLAGWTDSDEAGATSQWLAGGYLELIGTGTNAAIRDQQVVVAAGDINHEHALRIVIERGPVMCRIGSTLGGAEYVSEATLATGVHSLAFTPAGDFFIRFFNRLERTVYINSCNVEAAGMMEIPTPWPAAALGLVRSDESADVVFCACYGYQQRRIERRSTRSWSVVKELPEDGPFRIQNTSTLTLTPSGITGNGSLTASAAFFSPLHQGALFALTTTGQVVLKAMAVVNDATASVHITGTGTDRGIAIYLTGLSGTGNTVVLQRSADNAVWAAVAGKSWVADTSESYNDALDNQALYYRLLCSVYAGGLTTAQINVGSGSIRGICRVTQYFSSTLVAIEILRALGAPAATTEWEEGQWSDYRGWPSSVTLYEGRLWWPGKDAIVGSVSDAYSSFDPETVGDSGPINRTLPGAQVDNINWVLPLQRLVLGGDGAEYSCKSSSLDEPLTPSNFNPKRSSTQGSAPVRALTIDYQGVFVQRGGTRIFTLALGGNSLFYDYAASDLTAIVPEICQPGIVRIAVQRQPDTRIHCVRSDGTVALLIFDSNEQVTCWVEIETLGLIEDVVVLPGDDGENEDHVYYVVQRTINGATVRYLERWAMQSQCTGGQLTRLADAYVIYQGAAITAVGGLSHLEGQQVVVWADGLDVGTNDDDSLIYTVAGGQITLATAASNIVVGLPYNALFQSGKMLSLGLPEGAVINRRSAIRELSLLLADVHPRGLRFGRDFDNLDDLPSIEGGAAVDQNTVHADYAGDPITFPGGWSSDERLCLHARSPRPVTVLAAVQTVET